MPVTPSATLTADLRALVLKVEADLRERVSIHDGVEDRWRAEHDNAVAAHRTAASWQEWSGERVTQAAVAWVLTTVFVRFCEDNRLLGPVWIAGPPERRGEAVDAQTAFLRAAARRGEDVTDREWLLEAVRHLQATPATAALVAPTNPLWQVAISGDMATAILAFWRASDDDGRLVRNLTDEAGDGGSDGTGVLDTRFLGDLYQDLSEAARERYALLQTPEFVEEYILDLTLTPALAERPLEEFQLIDPTCGSGHFLLGAFDRLLDAWHTHDPGMETRARVQKTLDSVVGVDLNPFAVAVARFRLLVTALRAGGDQALDAPSTPGYRLNLAAGDSLIHGRGTDELDLGADLAADRSLAGFGYAIEDLAPLRDLLHEGTYDVVVGNPPYITVKDSALNTEYRRLYTYCKGTYALTVPFMERFFALARSGDKAGWVGQITSNSFMKREFGSKLIEDFLAKTDITHVVDTSGAYIPGHGTPTVIAVGRHRAPASATVRAVLGIRGEPGRPADPAKAIVWSAIDGHTADAGHEDEWITVTDLDRRRLATHPWSLSGGGASELAAAVDEAAARPLTDVMAVIGRTTHTGADDAFFVPTSSVRVMTIIEDTVPVVLGEEVRDFTLAVSNATLLPYDQLGRPRELSDSAMRLMWRSRRVLETQKDFGQYKSERGLRWIDHSMFFADRYRTPLSIAFAFVATHNHFVLDRGGKVFKQSAPVIKLPEGASEDDHLALLGVLNSSIACFWLKQNSHNKGSSVDTAGARQTQAPWENFYEFTATTLQDYPLPASLPTDRARSLDTLAQHLSAHSPEAVATTAAPTRATLDAAHTEHTATRSHMVAEQEELDWDVYTRYGLLDAPLTYDGGDLPPLSLGDRAFEIVLARRIAAGDETSTWFTRHGSTPITDLPAHWPAAYRDLVQRRINLIEADRNIRLLERPEHKRRWAWEGWDKAEERAVRTWLLDRLEDRDLWFDRQGRPRPRSLASLADDVGRDAGAVAVLAVWEGREDVPVLTSLTRLLAPESVPYLAAMRYKDPGLRKRAAWEDVWDRQRAEDASTYDARPVSQGGRGPIPVPPKYTGADFRTQAIWSHRGKLDVPKERFIAYPGAHRSSDPTPVIGWAGWDHAQQALACATLVQRVRDDGAEDDRMVPLLAGVDELLPWVRQWHADLDPAYGQSPADFFAAWLDEERTALAVTTDHLTAWRPAAATRGRQKKA